ncbi:MAG: diacylglycerol/lipid kinase family protein [Propionibacteriaceae bacterium]
MLSGRSVALVVNPTAGRGQAAKLLPEIIRRIEGHGADLEVRVGRDFADARALVDRSAEEHPDVVAVVGGDGMMHLGVNACARVRPGTVRPALALLPAGTGNDFCRGLGLDVDDTLAAVDLMGTTAPTPVDVTLARGGHGENVVGSVVAAGFDALVNRRANALRWPRGSMRYTVAALRELATFRPLHYRLVVDGVRRELDAMLVAVGSTSTYGGGMQICQGADPRDGLLDVTVVHPVGRTTLLRLLPRMRSGTFATDRCVEQLRAQEVVVEGVTADGDPPLAYGDGEELGPLPLTLTAVPGALSLFLPAR